MVPSDNLQHQVVGQSLLVCVLRTELVVAEIFYLPFEVGGFFCNPTTRDSRVKNTWSLQCQQSCFFTDDLRFPELSSSQEPEEISLVFVYYYQTLFSFKVEGFVFCFGFWVFWFFFFKV